MTQHETQLEAEEATDSIVAIRGGVVDVRFAGQVPGIRGMSDAMPRLALWCIEVLSIGEVGEGDC